MRVALRERRLAHAAELDDCRLRPVGEVGVAVAELLGEVELEALGELARAVHGVAVVGKAVEHVLWREEHGFVVAAPLPLAALERGATADGNEDVLKCGAAAVVRVDISRCDSRDAERLGELAQARVATRVAALVRTLEFYEEAVTES